MVYKMSNPGSTMNYVRRLVKEFEEACEHKVMKGSYHPDDQEGVDEWHAHCKKKLINYIGSKIRR